MAIFRGIGGAGDSTTDATVTAVTEQAVNAATSATQAASSASSAASSASSASTSATNAAASASTASDAATAAQTAQTNAETAETNAETAQTAAEAAQTAAETAETNAETAETNAETAEANAVTAKNSAEAAQTAAETAETNAETAYANTLAIFGDAQDVQDAVDNAETAYANTLAIFGDAQDVQDAVDSASASAATATTKASEASASASNASTSETNALNSATSANTSATNASNSATAAAGSATDANTYKLAAQDAQVAAEAAQLQTENLFDQFGDQYLGSKASDPTVDNDGDPLTTGDIYWNSTSNTLRFYSGTAWVAPETIATNAATAAQTAQTAAETAQTAAETAETNAETAETNAAASASSASTSATNAANSATAASNSATAASNSASAAATSATNAENAYDSFDDRYLGVKASDPALDNDGAALLTGALYFNSTDNEMRVYTGSVWIAVVDLAGDVTVTSLTASSVDINGGAIDGTTIGATTPSTGDFTTLTENDSPAVVQSDIGTDPDEIPLNQYLGSMAYVDADSVNIDGGTIDGVTIGGASAGAITGTTITGTQFSSDATDVELKYSGSTKLATTNTGIDVTGTVTADGLTIEGSAGPLINLYRSDVNALFGAIQFKDTTNTNENARIGWAANELRLQGTNQVSLITDEKTRLFLASTGDISFYEDTGTSQNFYWDASTSKLGLGTTAPLSDIHIAKSAPIIRMQDTDNDSYAMIMYNTASGGLLLRSDANQATGTTGSNIIFETDGSEAMRIDSSGNLLVGTTDNSPENNSSGTSADDGIALMNAGYISACNYEAASLFLNRTSTDGTIVDFRKDGAP
jgi:hypothetical protein